MDCEWIILAPYKNRIMIQFNFLNIEKSEFCNNDFLEFKSVNNISTKFCGDDDRKRYISNENKIFIKFHSDQTLTFEGFLFRYLFISFLETNINEWKTNSTCNNNEWKCELGESCIPKRWRCDNIRDCRDNSDEISCNSVRSCHQSQVSCLNGGCLPKEFVCNGINDCPDNSDENLCNFNKSFTEPFKPSEKNECSYQSIRPNFLNDTFDNSQIVGGNVAVPGSWPWIISLRQGMNHYCGGSLITEQWVVTAAHCLNDPNPDLYSVDLGRYYLYFGNVINVQVDRIVIHPSYNIRTQDFDIALIKLKNKVKLSKSVQTVCLPDHATDSIKNSECVILGWGYTQGTGGEGILKQAMVSIIDKTTCNENYNGILTNQMICAGRKDGKVDACEGDSGGPLVCNYKQKYTLFGIVSFGHGCAVPNMPGIYTDVVKVINWIKDNLKENKATSKPSFTPVTTNISHSSKSPVVFSTQITEQFNMPSNKIYHSKETESKTTNKINFKLSTNTGINDSVKKLTSISSKLLPYAEITLPDFKKSTLIIKDIPNSTSRMNINSSSILKVTNSVEKSKSISSTILPDSGKTSLGNKISTLIKKEISEPTKKVNIIPSTILKITDLVEKSKSISSTILPDLGKTSPDNKISTLIKKEISEPTKKVNIIPSTILKITDLVEKSKSISSTILPDSGKTSLGNKISTLINKEISEPTKKVNIIPSTILKITDLVEKSKSISSTIFEDLKMSSSDNKIIPLITKTIPNFSITDKPSQTIITVSNQNNDSKQNYKKNEPTKNPLFNAHLTPKFDTIKIATNEINFKNSTLMFVSDASIKTNDDSTSTVIPSIITSKKKIFKNKLNFN